MAEAHPLLQTLAGFAKTLTHGYEISDVLHDLTERVSAVLGIAGAGVSLREDGRLRFVTSDSQTLATLEQVQEEHQAGPCAAAAATSEPVLVTNLGEHAERWPPYVHQAEALQIVAVAAVPMTTNDNSIGTLDLYHTAARAWSTDDVATAQVLADIATSYLVNASRVDRHRRISEQLQRALNSRVIIEQAKGIIAAQQSISVDNAFQLLRQHARDHNTPLHALANAVVHLGLRL